MPPPKGSRAKELGLKGVETALVGIGRSPLDVVSLTHEHVDFGSADFNLHLSNTSYNVLGDCNRHKILIRVLGPAFAREGIYVAGLVEARTFFLREIPLFSPFVLETRFLTYDNDQWVYVFLRFLLPATKQTRSNPALKHVRDSQGNERVLAALLVNRGCFKMRGHKRSLNPTRVFVLAGNGQDGQNWEFAKQLRKERKAKAWLKEDGVAPGMAYLEERRAKILELTKALDDKASWLRLDDFVSSQDRSVDAA